jgi:hypothetical protein
MATPSTAAQGEESHWIVVDGRRWRATDPSIPEPFRRELVEELMEARREVARARKAADPEAERIARRRVRHAKVALGERGEPWWDEPTPKGRSARLRAVVLALVGHRAPRTICPSDVARAVGGAQWRALLEPVRDEVRALGRDGEVDVTQRGEILDPNGPWRGPVRIRARRRSCW